MEGERTDKVRMSHDSGMSSVGSESPAEESSPAAPNPEVIESSKVTTDLTCTMKHPLVEEPAEKHEKQDENVESASVNKDDDDETSGEKNQSATSTDSSAFSGSSLNKIDPEPLLVAELPPVSEESDDKLALSPELQPDFEQTEETQPTFMIFYLGSLILDRRHTQTMLPWVMAEVRRRHEISPIKLSVHPEMLLALSADGEGKVVFEHKLQGLSRFARTHQDLTIFAYSTRSGAESPFTCHVFQAMESEQVSFICFSHS